MKISLVWNNGAIIGKRKRIEQAQNYVDEACVEGMTEFVPVALPEYPRAGKLRDSVVITQPGHIIYTSDNAEHQYYDALDHSDTGNPKATRLWFETMKKKYAAKILDGAQDIIRKGKVR